MEASVNLHAGIPVIVKRAFAHAVPAYLKPVTLSGLAGFNSVFDSRKKIHT